MLVSCHPPDGSSQKKSMIGDRPFRKIMIFVYRVRSIYTLFFFTLSETVLIKLSSEYRPVDMLIAKGEVRLDLKNRNILIV